jgi:hypothetical protein
MKNLSIRLASAVAALALATPGLQSVSQARTLLPSAGRTINVADQGCFALAYSSMTNVCGSVKSLEIPLTHDAPAFNWISPKITAQGNGVASNVGCDAVAVHKSLGYFWSNNIGREYLSVFGSAQDITLDVYAPGDTGVYVSCEVGPGARVNLVSW